MRTLVILCYCCLGLLFCTGCGSTDISNRVIVIQPFQDFPSENAQSVFRQVRAIHPNTVLRLPIQLPHAAWYPERSRYRADTLIAFLKRTVGNSDSVVIGLTSKDISTTKGEHADWGVMGLAYRPGNACVVSSFRLAKARVASQFYKVAVHELGHTQGLPHCPVKTCFMRDAEGGNPTDDETDFCPDCKQYLKRKGWQLK